MKAEIKEFPFCRFKGTKKQYSALHYKMRTSIGVPKKCQLCHHVCDVYDLANISQNYLEQTSDWMYLCKPCHGKFDSPYYSFSSGEWNRLCLMCKETKSVSLFYPRKATQIGRYGTLWTQRGYTSWCKECTKKWSRDAKKNKVS